ncbi:hypothetical protein Tco_1139492, partial [Tanacetum coccineum]
GMRSKFCSDLTSSLSEWGWLTVVDIGLGGGKLTDTTYCTWIQIDKLFSKELKGVFVSVKKAPPKKTWKVSESLFPCALSQESTVVSKEAVNLAVSSWGHRSLAELKVEERLSYACEKGLTQDEVIAKLRDAFLKIAKNIKPTLRKKKRRLSQLEDCMLLE